MIALAPIPSRGVLAVGPLHGQPDESDECLALAPIPGWGVLAVDPLHGRPDGCAGPYPRGALALGPLCGQPGVGGDGFLQ